MPSTYRRSALVTSTLRRGKGANAVASVDENFEMWQETYRWPDAGDEWSSGWGGPHDQWRNWLAPRLAASTGGRSTCSAVAVEIGCGHGRWTQFLASAHERVIAVDLAPACVAATRARFEDDDSVTVLQCDGSSLRGVEDASVDLVFSFDSLVHADAITMDAYVAECARVLRLDGVAFLHHSNLGACVPDRSRLLQRRSIRRFLASMGIAEPNVHWRDPTVDADVVARSARRHGLVCVEQELLTWGTRRQLIDCISILQRGTERQAEPSRVVNRRFMTEMDASGRQAAGRADPGPDPDPDGVT